LREEGGESLARRIRRSGGGDSEGVEAELAGPGPQRGQKSRSA